jgi:hypothetical protein
MAGALASRRVAAGAPASCALVAGEGPVRVWRGVLVQSLDRVARGAAGIQATGVQPSSASRWPFPGARAAEQGPQRSARPLQRGLMLSNERTITIWAYSAKPATIHARPHADARAVSRLRWYTEDGFPENYLLLRLHRDAAGREWVKLRIPMLPNGQVGWVRREALGSFHTTRDLLTLDRRRLRLKLFSDGRIRWSAPVGVGGDEASIPPGRFWIRERLKIFDPGSDYWPYAFGTADYSERGDRASAGVVGIHGSHVGLDATSGLVSDRCIRLHVADAAWLGRHLGLGTPLRIV